jgi:hypothetical protein
MRCTEILKTSVSLEMKLQAKVIADRELLSEATWLKRLVIREIRARNDASNAEGDLAGSESIPRPTRAAAGKNGAGKPMLVRLTAEDRRPGSVRGEFEAILKICTALRDNTKALLNANLTSWAAGHARGDD